MLTEALKNAASIAIAGHVRPDGDCAGSCLGMCQYIRENFPEKEVQVYLEKIPDIFSFMEGSDRICHEIPSDKVYDLFITLDCGDLSRLGFAASLFQSAKDTLCIDHHISNQSFAKRNHIDPDASSTSELVFHLMEYDKISIKTAECLYTGIVHDTGVFRYSCTAPSTMKAAAALMEKGIPFSKIINDTFDEMTYAQQRIMGYTLLNNELVMEGRCITAVITREEMERYHVEPLDLDGIVSQLRLTKGVEVAVFLYEQDEDTFKASLRSAEYVDVSAVAQHFGGGGHVRASGATMKGKPSDILKDILGQIALQIDK